MIKWRYQFPIYLATLWISKTLITYSATIASSKKKKKKKKKKKVNNVGTSYRCLICMLKVMHEWNKLIHFRHNALTPVYYLHWVNSRFEISSKICMKTQLPSNKLKVLLCNLWMRYKVTVLSPFMIIVMWKHVKNMCNWSDTLFWLIRDENES